MSDKIHKNVWERAKQAKSQNKMLVLFRSGKSIYQAGLDDCNVFFFTKDKYDVRYLKGLTGYSVSESEYRSIVATLSYLTLGLERVAIFIEEGCEIEMAPIS